MNKNARKVWLLAMLLAAPALGRAATATLSWNAVVQNADGTPLTDLSGYRVFYATYSLLSLTTTQAMAQGSVTKTGLLSGITTTFNTLADGASYYFRVTAIDMTGNQSAFCQAPVEVSTFTPAAAPPATPPASPGTLSAAAVSASQINLTWVNVAGEDGYRIERSLTGGSGYVQVATAAVNATGYADMGLLAGTTYYYRVRAYNGAGNSGYSNPASAKTLGSAVTGTSIAPPPGLKEAYAYPNPAVGTDPVICAMMGGVEYVEVTIFDQAGRVVHAGRTTTQTTVNGSPAFEYRWTGEKAIGVYYAVIHGRKGDETIRARAKFAVAR